MVMCVVSVEGVGGLVRECESKAMGLGDLSSLHTRDAARGVLKFYFDTDAFCYSFLARVAFQSCRSVPEQILCLEAQLEILFEDPDPTDDSIALIERIDKELLYLRAQEACEL